MKMARIKQSAGNTFTSILIVLSFVLFVLGGYSYFNQPTPEPEWPDVIPGFAYSPYQAGENPFDRLFPSEEAITGDLELLAGQTHALRTYTVEDVFGKIPELAREFKLNVATGAWLSQDKEFNKQELARLVEVINKNRRNVVRAVVGNETLLRKDLTLEQLTSYLDEVRKQVKIPVSTAEPWHVWIKNPELADHVDYIAVHMLPFWEGIAVEQAVDYISDKYELLRFTFPNKPIVIGEVGWPSHGRSIRDAEASQANQAIFLRRFIQKAQKEEYVYYIMEAFDQPWKSRIEGSIGGHWGVYDVGRQQKFEMINPVIAIPEWRFLAAASVLVALILVLVLLVDSSAMGNRGRAFLVSVAFGASSLIIYVIYDYSLQYQNWISMTVGILLLLGVVGVFVVVMAEAHEWAEALWYRTRRRASEKLIAPDATYHPLISVHVPAYNEPPEMLIQTLDALAALDYPEFEVIVIDNNTPDEATWKPVEQHCATLGGRFRFFHKRPLEGYKAGALNFALEQTDPRAEIVAVIDSDYIVEPTWLSNLGRHFANPNIAIVQAPQDYRDGKESLFKSMCYAEYKGFFHLGMVTRNERNAIIQHGTMTMVRRSVLEGVGRWGEDTITEDAELGLRIFEQGYEAAYTPSSYGKGLIPDTFIAYKKQRYRWAYGAMQILRSHARQLLNMNGDGLKPGQRYHFLAGWLPWIADGFNLIFTAMAIFWSLLMLLDPITYNAPPMLISLIPVFFFGFKIVKMLALYLGEVRTGLWTAIAASVAGLSLSYTIARATLSGLFVGRKMPFMRTPKNAPTAALLKALNDAREESLIAALLIALIATISYKLGFESRETLFWTWVLMVQTVPFVVSLLVSIISALPARRTT